MTKEQIKKELPLRLREWFQNQTRWKKRVEIAKHLNINEKTLDDYFNGRNYPKKENLKKLAELTKLPMLVELQQNQNKNKMPQPTTIKTKRDDDSALQKANVVHQKLSELDNLLEYFKKGTAKEREMLRYVIPPMQIGYITSLLKALYNEDEFQQWIFFSDYKMKK